MLPGPSWFGGSLFQDAFKTPARQVAVAPMPQWPRDPEPATGNVGGGTPQFNPTAGTLAVERPQVALADSSLRSKWTAQLGDDVHTPTLHVPYRYDDRGWFDYNPMLMSVPMALWHHSVSAADRERIERLRAAAGYDWRTVRAFRNKEEAGHEEPWFAFLRGDDPGYPERILAAAQAQVRHRLARMERYRGRDVSEDDIHLWQQSNPVVTEALVQLTWGGPQVIYNGGLQQARVRYPWRVGELCDVGRRGLRRG